MLHQAAANKSFTILGSGRVGIGEGTATFKGKMGLLNMQETFRPLWYDILYLFLNGVYGEILIKTEDVKTVEQF